MAELVLGSTGFADHEAGEGGIAGGEEDALNGEAAIAAEEL
jgi:hypothetical protein